MDIQTRDSVLVVLGNASSQDPTILKPAEQKLIEWETQPGFYPALIAVISNYEIPTNIRWMAVLCFKNATDKYWRKNAPNALPEDEKITLRNSLLSNFEEPVNQIAVQLAASIAKIARIDYPNDWPDLFPILLSAMEQKSEKTQYNAILIFHHVVKTLSTKCLIRDKKNFQNLTDYIYSNILNSWNYYTEAFLNNINSNEAPAQTIKNLSKALLLLKILRKLTVFGLQNLCECDNAIRFLNIIFERAKSSLESRKLLKGKGILLLELCEKFIINLTKVLLSVLEYHPLSFVNYIEPTLQFTTYYIFLEGEPLIYERFVIQCMNLIKAILMCAEYKVGEKMGKTINQEAVLAFNIKQKFLQPDLLKHISKKLISHYLLLNQDDLALWDSDPEEFIIDEGGDSWKYSLKPCVETILVFLFRQYNDILIPVLQAMILETHEIVSPDNLHAILQKDAIYNAVGLTAYELFDIIDFDQWYINTLSQELKIKHTHYRIIRKRIAWLIGTWSGVRVRSDLYPTLYNDIMKLLEHDEDLAVRLTAAEALRKIANDFDFNCEQLRPFLSPIFASLFDLIKVTTESDSKMQILNIMTIIIERIGIEIRPYSEPLLQCLPELWSTAGDHHLLRCAIIGVLIELVKAVNTINPSCFPLFIPIIQLGTDVNQEFIVYLLEDTLELWLVILQNSATITPELMQLFSIMPTLLDYSTENLRSCLHIIQAQILLAPEETLKIHGSPVILTLLSLINDLKFDAVGLVLRLIDICLRVAPTVGFEIVQPMLPLVLWKCATENLFPKTMWVYIMVTARLILFSYSAFTEILITVAQANATPPEVLFENILDSWLSALQYVSQPEQKKLSALALASLLTIENTQLFERFTKIIEYIIETINDITIIDEDGVFYDSLVITDMNSPSEYTQLDFGTEDSFRKRKLMSVDPVHTVILKDYFNSQLIELKRKFGQEVYEKLIGTLEVNLVAQFGDAMTSLFQNLSI